MAITRATTAEKIINRAAIEIGLSSVPDPYSSTDESFKQLTALLNTAGEELAIAYQWEFLTKEHQIITTSGDSGDYELPDDFLYFIPQTGWERANDVPLFGPLTAQDWTYLHGRDLVGHTIYASFRLRAGKFSIFPQPPPDNLDINFEYQSKNWVLDSSTEDYLETDEAVRAGDRILFDKVLVSRYLKVKYLETKGLDSSKARDDFYQSFSFLTNHDKSAGAIINVGSRSRGFPYLDQYRNTPSTGYGVP